MTSHILTISELAHRSGLTAHTIRFYESAGILHAGPRAANGHRRYHAADVRWIEFVLKLKRTDMPLAQIRLYAALRAQGESTLQQRLTMLKLHRDRLATRMAELCAYSDALDEKIRVYQTWITPTAQDTNLEDS